MAYLRVAQHYPYTLPGISCKHLMCIPESHNSFQTLGKNSKSEQNLQNISKGGEPSTEKFCQILISVAKPESALCSWGFDKDENQQPSLKHTINFYFSVQNPGAKD